VIKHPFIRSFEGIMANIRIYHRDFNQNNAAEPLEITPVEFMADAKQTFPFPDIIFNQDATSREEAIACRLYRCRFPL
jgi:hypothetical protein